MGQKTTKIANIYGGRGQEYHIIVDHNAKSKIVKVYRKWYEHNSETDYGYHRKKINEFDSYADALMFVTNVVAGVIKLD